MTAALEWLGVGRGARAERRLWRNAPTVEHLAELMAWFCLGELARWPGHDGPTDPETREADLGPVLAAANRRGFITLSSQPGVDLDAEGWEQRAAVDGLATPAVLAQLRALVGGTRLLVVAHPASKWRRDYSRAVDTTRVGEHDVTSFGSQVPPRDIRFMFPGVPDHVVDELVAMWQVAIVDPRWGAHRLLWDRLAEPDWDRPSPLPRTAAPAAPPRTTSPGGTAMSASIQEIQSVLASITAATAAGRGPIQQLIDDATRERARLQASMDGSHQHDVEAAVAMLTLLISTLEDALGYSHETVSSVERIGQRL